MNVLFFVMTMLMLLALMTYGRLESYLGFAFVQAQFKEYMQKTERRYVNEAAYERYQEERGSTRSSDETEGNERNEASSKLSFNLFIDKEARANNPKELEVQLLIAKNLLYFLYGDQQFYIEMEEKRPDLLNEILAALMQSTEELSKERKLNTQKVMELATVDLGDQELNEVFTKMLKGTAEMSEGDEAKAEGEAAAAPFKSPGGYYSLLDFITLQKNKNRIRVFLASPQLLMAIYGNSDTVKQILEVRNRLYLNLRRSSDLLFADAAKNAQEEFQRLFQNLQLPSIPLETLDFGVSKTDPKKYE